MTAPSPERADDVLTRPAALPEAVLRYADHADGILDLHLPGGPGPHPLVVLLHGGFWKQAYDRRHQRPLARALVDAGAVVAAPEYRRVGGAGGWPETGDDVRTAVDALPRLLDGLGVATAGLTVAGHSAGGQLALWLGARRAGIDRVVALAPVADLDAAAAAGLGDGAVPALLGGTPDEVPDRYAQADPLRLLAHAPPGTAVTVLHGTDDTVVPVSQARVLAERHPRVTLTELACGHYEVIDPCSAVWPAVRSALLPGRAR